MVPPFILLQNTFQFDMPRDGVSTQLVRNRDPSFEVCQLRRQHSVLITRRGTSQDAVHHEVQIRVYFRDGHVLRLLYRMTVGHVLRPQLLRRFEVIVEVVSGVAHTEGEVLHVLKHDNVTALISSEVGRVPQRECFFSKRERIYLRNTLLMGTNKRIAHDAQGAWSNHSLFFSLGQPL